MSAAEIDEYLRGVDEPKRQTLQTLRDTTLEVVRSNWDALPPKRPARLIGKRRCLGEVIAIYRFPDFDGQLEAHDATFATKHGHHLLRLDPRPHPRRRRHRALLAICARTK